MLEKLPPEIGHFFAGLIGLLPAAFIARLLHHHKMVRAGHRRFWSMELVWELPTAVFCAIIGGGIAEFMQLEGMAAHAVVGTVGWLGPRTVDVALAYWLDRKETGR